MGKENRIGALWRSKSTSEKAPFAKGSIELDGQKIPVVIWLNGWKAQDLESDDPEKREKAHRQPDYYIERDQMPARDGAAASKPDIPRPQAAQGANAQQEFEDDIPF